MIKARIDECILVPGFPAGEILEEMADLINTCAQSQELFSKKRFFSSASTRWRKWRDCMDFPEISGITI